MNFTVSEPPSILLHLIPHLGVKAVGGERVEKPTTSIHRMRYDFVGFAI